MEDQTAGGLRYVPLSVLMEHIVSRDTQVAFLSSSLGTRETITTRFTQQQFTLLPSSNAFGRTKGIRHQVTCGYCGRVDTLSVEERTIAVLRHELLRKPESTWVLRRLFLRVFFSAHSAIVLPGMAVLFFILLSLLTPASQMDRIKALGPPLALVTVLLEAFGLATAARAAFIYWLLRTRPVILGLRNRPSKFDIDLSRLDGVLLCRYITKVEFVPPAALAHKIWLPAESNNQRTMLGVVTDLTLKSVRREFEKFAFAQFGADIKLKTCLWL